MKVFTKFALMAAFVVAVSSMTSSCCCTKSVPTYENSYYYGADGKFDQEKGKQAYFDLMEHYGYDHNVMFKPKDFWVLDFVQNDFANVGMGGVFFANENHTGGGYLAHEIYLLPGQMIPEHAHVRVKGVCPPKRESWLVRHGSAYSFSIDDQNQKDITGMIPASQVKYNTCNSWKLLKKGDVDTLQKAGSKHFLIAGPEGAIITEFATFHSNDGLRFSNPSVEMK